MALFAVILMALPASASDVSGGLALLDHGSARAASLADAYSAGFNDVTALQFNPASLGTLETGEASVFFQRGLENQSKGHAHIGLPSERWSTGFSLGYFNGGNFEAVDGGASRSVTVQRDLSATLGTAVKVNGAHLGLAVKYLSSELIETVTARTVAVDAGLHLPVSPRLRLSAAAQNFGPGLKFRNERDNLPRLIRGGFSLQLPGARTKNTLYADLPYLLNERELTPAIGLDVSLGVVSLRGGFAHSGGELRWTVGTGVGFGAYSLDYGVSMMSELNARHQVNVSARFGTSAPRSEIARIPEFPKMKQRVAPVEPRTAEPRRVRHNVYVVQAGDSLASIAKKHYGTTTLWRYIYNANKHLLPSPDKVAVGQKLSIPRRTE